MVDPNLYSEPQTWKNEVEKLNDDLLAIMEKGCIDDIMLQRLTDTILEDLKCTEVSFWTINRNYQKVDGSPRPNKDKYLSTSLVCRSKKEDCGYEFNEKQEFTHSLTKQECLFAKVVDDVSIEKPYTPFSSKEAIEEGFTSKEFIKKAGIKDIYVIPITENDENNASKEAIAIVELSFSNSDKKNMMENAIRIHSVCSLALRNYTGLQKQRFINIINKSIDSQAIIDEANSESVARKEKEERIIASLCKIIIDSILDFLPCQGASLFLKDPIQNVFCLKHTTGVCNRYGNRIEDVDNVRYSKGEGLTGMVGENGKIFISDNLAKDHISKTHEIVQGDKSDIELPPIKRVKTGMFIPIISTQDDNSVIGIVRLVNKKNKCNPGFVDFFNDVDEDIMAFASKYLSAIIESQLKGMELRGFEKLLSHEVKRPACLILDNSDWLKNSLENAEMYKGKSKKHHEIIIKQAKRQLNNIKVIKKLFGRESYSIDGGDLYNILEESWDAVEPIETHDISINIAVPKDKYTLYVDKDAFIMVFSNLFENAIKYRDMTEKGPRIIYVNIDENKDRSITILVQDYGIGIKEDEKESVFKEGYQGKNLQDRGKDGSGLGLTIVKRVIEDFEGKVSIIRCRKPTTFEIELPKKIVHYNK